MAQTINRKGYVLKNEVQNINYRAFKNIFIYLF